MTHAGENLLILLRDGALQVTPEIIDALLAMVDAVRQMLASIEARVMRANEMTRRRRNHRSLE